MNALRVIAWMEGVSFLLFGVSMPLKYGFDIPELPEEIIQLNDGASIDVSDDGDFLVNN